MNTQPKMNAHDTIIWCTGMSYYGLVYAQFRLCFSWNVYYKKDDVAE